MRTFLGCADKFQEEIRVQQCQVAAQESELNRLHTEIGEYHVEVMREHEKVAGKLLEEISAVAPPYL